MKRKRKKGKSVMCAKCEMSFNVTNLLPCSKTTKVIAFITSIRTAFISYAVPLRLHNSNLLPSFLPFLFPSFAYIQVIRFSFFFTLSLLFSLPSFSVFSMPSLFFFLTPPSFSLFLLRFFYFPFFSPLFSLLLTQSSHSILVYPLSYIINLGQFFIIYFFLLYPQGLLKHK